MSIDQIIEKIIQLPRLFKSLENKSFYLLLKDTGYFEIAQQVNEEDISNALKRHPGCIDEWKLLSDNKRTSSGWYFNKLDNTKYIVGYFDLKRKDNPNVEFSDIKEACAFFIKREIEDIRLTPLRNPN